MRFRKNQLVVYHKQKHGIRPGPRARDLRPTPQGNTYDYFVDKFWIMTGCTADGHLLLRTPGGKLHAVDPRDPCVRRPTVREWLWLRLRARRRLRALRQNSS